MALLHKAQIVPGKVELLARWLPTRSWYSGPAGAPERVAAARFDDPAGEVGVETMILRSGDGSLLHVPLTYRGVPLAGAERWLIGTTEHSVLGTRWVYDGVGDPVYAAQLAEVIRTAGQEAVEEIEIDGELIRREPSLHLRGSGAVATTAAAGPSAASEAGAFDEAVIADGDPAIVRTATQELTVLRALGPVPPGAALTGSWDSGSPVVLATLTLR